MAKERGLSVLAITDHDTIAGADEAQRTGEALGLHVIGGVELSTKEYKNFRIWGYCFQASATELASLCKNYRAGQDERKYRIIDFFHAKNIDIDLSEVEILAVGEVIARPHFAQVMVQHGYASTNREAFDR